MNELTNRFKQALREKRPQIGLWLGLADAYAAEVCATAGFDWLLVDGEHAPNDVRTILAQLQALAPYPSHPIVRPYAGETALIKRLLDVGARTLLVPMVDTAAQARQLVAATRYPPAGQRGVASALARASRWDETGSYLDLADDQICLLIQAESRTAVENIDAIVAVEGVEGVFVGPSDLAASLGHRGDPGHPEVQQAIEHVIGRILAGGKAAGILARDEKLARRYLALGCTFVAVGADISLLATATRALAGRFRQS